MAVTVETCGRRVPLSQLIRDFYADASRNGYWLYSAWIEILLSYRSTILGPLWILVGTAAFVLVVGPLYGRVILADGSNIYLAHLAVGITLWYFITQTAVGSCHVFMSNRASILDGAISYTSVILKLLATNLIYFLHNCIIVIIAMIVSKVPWTATDVLVALTIPLVVLNILWMCVILAILGARYPDLEEFVQSILRLLFFVTPILWVPHGHFRGAVVDALLYFNPFYYFVEAIRVPLLYDRVPYFEIGVLCAALPLGWLAASILYARTRPWIGLWL